MAADAIYDRLPKAYQDRITDKDLYLLGSQGGDLYFFYNNFLSSKNVGRMLHQRDAMELFTTFQAGTPSYIAGFATHYAMDSVLHPYVYQCQDERHGTFFFHMRFEADLGLYISRVLNVPRDRMDPDIIQSKTEIIYENLKLVDDRATPEGMVKGMKGFEKYVQHFYKAEKDYYKVKHYDFDSLHDPLMRGIDKGVLCVQQVLDNTMDPELFSAGFSDRFPKENAKEDKK